MSEQPSNVPPSVSIPAEPETRGSGILPFAILASVLTLLSVAWALELQLYIGLYLFNEQFLIAMLGIALTAVFIGLPVAQSVKKPPVPLYDWVLAALAAGCAIFIYIKFPDYSELQSERPLDGLIVAFIMVLLVLEALRRTVGNVLVLVVLGFVVYGLLGQLIPGELQGRPVKLDQLVYYLIWDGGSMLGTPVLVASTIVIAFVLFGFLLFESGGSEFFTDVSLSLMGRYRGGSAKIAVTASGLFGSISGSAVSNVMSTGVITIPLMRQGGYRAQTAGAIEAVASTGGQLMPPVMGAAAFLMAEFLQVPYSDVVIAALLPAILYYVALFIQADLIAAREGIERVPEDRIPAIAGVLRKGWHYPIPFVVLIGGMFWMNWSPQMAALIASAFLVVLGYIFGYGELRMSWDGLTRAVVQTGKTSLDMMTITAAAGFIIGVLNISGLGFSLTYVLVTIGGGNVWLLLAISAVVCIILGMGMPTVGVYVLLATLVAPSLVKVGITPMAAHMFVMYFGMMSMITPPVAVAAFAGASLAGSDAMQTGWEAVRFGWVAYIIPFLFVAAPSLLLDGTPVAVTLAIITSLFGVWLVSAAVVGYFSRPLDWPMRALFALAGIMMFIPAGAIPYGHAVDAAGFVLGVVLAGREYLAVRNKIAGASGAPAGSRAGP
ncbi:MAG: TRAP transporter permease [Beijerinckiaceae bacterium]